MTIEAIAAAAAGIPSGAASGPASGGVRQVALQPTVVSQGATPAPAAGVQMRFDAAMERISGYAPASSAQAMPQAVTSMMNAIDQVNVQAKSVSDYAKTAQASDGTMSPGEIVNLTMRCQEFMFQCQLTSNIANRSADGVQQLFRQQG